MSNITNTISGKMQKFLMIEQVVFKTLKILTRNPEGGQTN
jgi:hypothetical protein